MNTLMNLTGYTSIRGSDFFLFLHSYFAMISFNVVLRISYSQNHLLSVKFKLCFSNQ